MSSRAGVRSIALNASHLASARLTASVLRGIYAIALTRLLGPELYGMFGYGQAWYLSFLPLTLLGMDSLLSQEIGRNRSIGGRVVSATFVLRALVTLMVAIGCGVTGWLVESSEEVRYLILIFAIALIGRSVGLWTQSIFIAYEKARYVSIQEALFRPAEMLIGVVILLLGGSLLSLALVHALSWWAQAAYGLIRVRRDVVKFNLEVEMSTVQQFLRKGAVIGLAGVFVTLISQTGILLYRLESGLGEQLGQLVVATQVLFLMTTIPASIAATALPILSRSTSRKDGKEYVYLGLVLRISPIVGSFLGLLLYLIGPEFIPFVFGEAYSRAGELVGPITFVLVPTIWGGALSHACLLRDKLNWMPVVAAVGCIAQVLTFYATYDLLDALAAIVATGVGLLTWVIGLMVALRQDLPGSIFAFAFRASVASAGSVGIYAACISSSVAPVIAFSSSVFGLLLLVILLRVIPRSELTDVLQYIRSRGVAK